MQRDDLPQLPKRNIQKPEHKVINLKPGERAVLMTFAVRVDTRRCAWIDGNSVVSGGSPVPRLTLLAERTESGFILWLDKETTFKPQPFSPSKGWLPVVEFRKAEPQESEDDDDEDKGSDE